jgi:cytochrome c oxidase subunit 4
MVSWRSLLATWLLLLLLLALTIGASFLLSGAASLTGAFAIATAKTALIYWVFMQLSAERGLVRLMAVGAFGWLLILGALAATDYAMRP